MTDKNKTDITVVLDRSGSMMTIANDMVGGFASFVAEQAKQPGECLISLYRFDNEYEVVFEGVSADKVPPLELTPRGSTALLDAVGRAIFATGKRLASLPEDQRPGAVVFLIITDGQENASSEFSYAGVQVAIERQKKEFNWQFVYLGSDLSTPREASRLGTHAVQYQDTAQSVGALYSHVGAAVSNLRSATRAGHSNAQLGVEPLAPESGFIDEHGHPIDEHDGDSA